jgi:glycosyltransferase involved in cell wall biosynthesis
VRVLFLNDLCDPRIGSSIRQMYQQAERLRDLGHETAVVSTTTDRGEAGRTTIEGCEVFRLHSDYPFRFRAWVAIRNGVLMRPLRAILREWRPDVVHSHIVHTHLSYAALTEARRAGAGVVFTSHDSMTFCYQKLSCFHGGEASDWALKDYRAYAAKCVPCQRFRFRPGRNRAIRKVLSRDVDRFTVVSDELGAAIRANGIRVDRTIGNAIRLQPRLPDAAEVVAFRERFGLADKQLIAIGGRLHDLKGIVQLFRMLAVLRGEFPRLRLLVMGREQHYREAFEHHAVGIGVDDMVVPTGWLDGGDLQCAYAALDVLASPSICFETFGMLNLEAMEHGVPVVATSFGGCPEVVLDGETGFVANPFDVPAFAERIARLLRDPNLARRMGEAGRRRLHEHFTIDRLTDEFLEEYECAVRRQSPR